ncbi:T9SS type A sorting domain-containing protein, partial [bacterium]|nr:T9SS type A sorting domain-containing protein [bacterium]
QGKITIEQVELRDSLNNSIQIYGSSQVNISKPIQNLDSVYCYPNPTKTGGITFANLPDKKIKIKIFDIAGEKVLDKEITPTDDRKWQWNLTNEKGAKVASGIYIYLLSDESLTKKGKLAISK